MMAGLVQSVWSNCARSCLCTACVLVVLVLAGCHRQPAEQQIGAAINATAAAVRTNDVHAVLDVVSDDFVGSEGVDKRQLHRLLSYRALRHDKTGVVVGPIKFEHRGARIVATFHLILTGGKRGPMLPDHSRILDMTTAWRRDGDDWLCYHARWK